MNESLIWNGSAPKLFFYRQLPMILTISSMKRAPDITYMLATQKSCISAVLYSLNPEMQGILVCPSLKN